jgi:outer membrane protein OmpA-like peptidoglycan-associated protein
MIKKIIPTIIFQSVILFAAAQQKNTANQPAKQDNLFIPISKADLGIFPYFKTFPNFQVRNESDSVTIEQNRAYLFDGKKYFSVDGKVSSQSLSITDNSKKRPSEFQIIQEFDKIVTTLGGKKIYTGQLPTTLLKPIAGTDDIVSLYSTHQIAPSAHYGVVEYVIKTPAKEVWIQLQPYSIVSGFYTLLIVEKQEQLLTTNTNKRNVILEELQKKSNSVIEMNFAIDSAHLLTQSSDEILNIVNVFQVHPDWKLKIEVHSAPVGGPGYILSLTQKRAAAIKNQLISLGVKESAIDAKGWGDTKPLIANETEKGRLTNTRVEIIKF